MENSTNRKLKQFAQSSAILIASNLVLKAINLFLLPLYTRYLTTEQLGISDTISNASSFVLPILVMALDSAFSAFYYDEKSEDHPKKVFNTILFTLGMASIVPILLSVLAVPFSTLLFGDGSYWLAVGISLVSVSLNLWYLPFSLLLRLQDRMLPFAIINIISSVSMIALNIVFVSVLHWGAYSLIISTAIVHGIQLILYVVFGKAVISTRYFDKALLKRMLHYSLPLIPSTVANWVLSLSDRYVLLAYCGSAEVGLYGIGARFATALSVVTSGVYMAYTTFAFKAQEDKDAKKMYAHVLNIFFVVMAALCFFISLFGKEIVYLMTSSGYHSAYLLLPCLVFSQLIYGINTIVGYGVSFAKKTVYFSISVWTGALVNLVLNFVFIPKYGAVAASATTLVGYITMTVLSYIFAQRLYPCDYRIGRIALTTAALFICSYLAMDSGLGLKIVLYIGLMLALLAVFRDTVRSLWKVLQVYLHRKRNR